MLLRTGYATQLAALGFHPDMQRLTILAHPEAVSGKLVHPSPYHVLIASKASGGVAYRHPVEDDYMGLDPVRKFQFPSLHAKVGWWDAGVCCCICWRCPILL